MFIFDTVLAETAITMIFDIISSYFILNVLLINSAEWHVARRTRQVVVGSNVSWKRLATCSCLFGSIGAIREWKDSRGHMIWACLVTCLMQYMVHAHQDKQGNQRWQTSPAVPPGGLGHCQTGMCMSNFMMIGWEMAEILHIEISWKHVSVTYDLDLWPKILRYYTLKFCENTDKHTDKHTHKHTNKQTWALQYLALPLWGAR